MSGTAKRSFTSFVRAPATPQPAPPVSNSAQPLAEAPHSNPLPVADPTEVQQKLEHQEGPGSDTGERTRVVTSTGRVRTYSASRNLPGVTLRLSESRWERLKILSIQERRPIQEILGEAMADYMRARGLPW